MSYRSLEQIESAVNQYTQDYAKSGGDVHLDNYIDAQDVRDLIAWFRQVRKDVDRVGASCPGCQSHYADPDGCVNCGHKYQAPGEAPSINHHDSHNI